MSTPRTAAGREGGSTWRALEVAMRRYLDAEPGNRDWMPVQEALWERDRFHAIEARQQDGSALRAALELANGGGHLEVLLVQGNYEQAAADIRAALPSAPRPLDVDVLRKALRLVYRSPFAALDDVVAEYEKLAEYARLQEPER